MKLVSYTDSLEIDPVKVRGLVLVWTVHACVTEVKLTSRVREGGCCVCVSHVICSLLCMGSEVDNSATG